MFLPRFLARSFPSYFYFSGQIYRSFTHSCSSALALEEIGECPHAFLLSLFLFFFHSTRVQDFYPCRPRTVILFFFFFWSGCCTRGRYENIRGTKEKCKRRLKTEFPDSRRRVYVHARSRIVVALSFSRT